MFMLLAKVGRRDLAWIGRLVGRYRR
jgi:hypothetical protein